MNDTERTLYAAVYAAWVRNAQTYAAACLAAEIARQAVRDLRKTDRELGETA